jgi:TonB family protein
MCNAMNIQRYLTFFLTLFSLDSFSQERELVTLTFPESKQLSESFYVLKSDSKIKHGEYVSYFRISDDVFKQVQNGQMKLENYIKVKGNYDYGKKSGDWIEYSSPSVLKFHGKYLANKKVGIWLTYKEHGQVEERYDYDRDLKLQPIIHLNTLYPPMAREKGIEGTVMVSYKINSNCTVSNIQLDKRLEADCDSVAIRSIRRFGELLEEYGVVCTDSIVKQDIKFVLK